MQRKVIVVTVLLFASVVSAEVRTIEVSKNRAVSIDAPSEWEQSIIPAEPGLPMNKVVLKKDINSQVQIMFIPITPDTPITKYKTPDDYIQFVHKMSCMQYVEVSVEGRYSEKKEQVGELTGYESVFNDPSYESAPPPPHEYKTVSRLTYMVGPAASGVIASVVLLSQGTEGNDYKKMREIVNSIKLSVAN
jgi:hypothetical protein